MEVQSFLYLLQLSDSAFPTGSFAHSMGLEAFAEAGELESVEDLKNLIGRYLASLATSDCVALRAAYDAELEGLLRVDRLLSATKSSRELRVASSAVGRRFLSSVSVLSFQDAILEEFSLAVQARETPGNLAVGYGVVGSALRLDREDILLAYLYSDVASLVTAGQRLIPLGGSVAQRALFDLAGEIACAAEKSEEMVPDEMYAFSPTIDVRSMLHERQRTRLYIS